MYSLYIFIYIYVGTCALFKKHLPTYGSKCEYRMVIVPMRSARAIHIYQMQW